MGFKRTLPPKRDRTGEFDSFVPRPSHAVVRMWSASLADAAGMMARADADRAAIERVLGHPLTANRGVPPKVTRKQRTRMDLRASANGEQCLMALPGCTGAAILSHNRHAHAGKGKGIKSIDLAGAYACTHCDAVYDGQTKRPVGWTQDAVELAWYRAHDQTLLKFMQKGLV